MHYIGNKLTDNGLIYLNFKSTYIIMNLGGKILKIAVILALLGIFVYGLKLGDFAETKSNGSALCLSCIGIG